MAKFNCFITCVMISAISVTAFGHGSTVSPKSRVYRVYQSNPENPNFELAAKRCPDGQQACLLHLDAGVAEYTGSGQRRFTCGFRLFTMGPRWPDRQRRPDGFRGIRGSYLQGVGPGQHRLAGHVGVVGRKDDD